VCAAPSTSLRSRGRRARSPDTALGRHATLPSPRAASRSVDGARSGAVAAQASKQDENEDAGQRTRSCEGDGAPPPWCVETDGGCDGATRARPESSEVKAGTVVSGRVCVYTGSMGRTYRTHLRRVRVRGELAGTGAAEGSDTSSFLITGQTRREQRGQERRRHRAAADLYFVFVRGVRVRAKM
jgi:hypothetical protein